jgi:ATP-dependent DNA ligase
LKLSSLWAVSALVRPLAFINPCLPILKRTAPSGPNWIHEIKFDGWRVQLHSDDTRIHVFSRNGRTEESKPVAHQRSQGDDAVRRCAADGA